MQSIVFCMLVIVGIGRTLATTDPLDMGFKNMEMIKKILEFKELSAKNIAFSPQILNAMTTQMALASNMCSTSFMELSSLLGEDFLLQSLVDFESFKERFARDIHIWISILTTNMSSNYENFIRKFYNSSAIISNKISSAIKEIGYNNMEFLMLVVYEFKFYENLIFGSEKKPFNSEDGIQKHRLYFFHTANFLHYKSANNDLEILKISISENFDMLILLPEFNKLDQLIAQLSENQIKEWDNLLVEENLKMYFLQMDSIGTSFKDILISLEKTSFFENHVSKIGNITLENSEIVLRIDIKVKTGDILSADVDPKFLPDRPHLVLILEKNTTNVVFALKRLEY